MGYPLKETAAPAMRCPACATFLLPDGTCLTCARAIQMLSLGGKPLDRLNVELTFAFD